MCEDAFAKLRGEHGKDNFLLPLLRWFGDNARCLPWRIDPTPYGVLVSETMLQQTRIATVIPYFERFMCVFPSIPDLAVAEESQVLKMWEGLGYYRRAKNLHFAAKQIMQDFSGEFPRTYPEVLRLKGVGKYTAGALCSLCFLLDTPAMDGNVFRVVSRYLACDLAFSCTADCKKVEQVLVPLYQATEKKGNFTEALMELGEVICTPQKVQCEICPVQSSCSAYERGLVETLPSARKKTKQTEQEITVFVLKKGEHFALCQRNQDGLLASLFEFPNVAMQMTAEQAMQQVSLWDSCQGAQRQPYQTRQHKHIFTHKIWHMKAYYFEIDTLSPQWQWYTMQQIQQELALPSAFSWIL